MKAYKIVVRGRVQKVGFRRHVQEVAQSFGLNGYVSNQEDGSVDILVQGGEEMLNRFVAMLRESPGRAVVADLQISDAEPREDLNVFRIVSGELVEELQEGFGVMESLFMGYWTEFKDFSKRTDENFQDLKGEIRGFSNRTDENFNTLVTKYGEISDKLTAILETLRTESAESRKELTDTRTDLKRSIDILAELVRSKL